MTVLMKRGKREVRFNLAEAFPAGDGFARVLFRLLMAANDLEHALRLMAIENDMESITAADEEAEGARRAYAHRLVCGHAYEALKIFCKLSRCPEVRPLVNQLAPETLAQYLQLEALVPPGGSHPLYELLKAIRTKLAFHYDESTAVEILKAAGVDYTAKIQYGGVVTQYLFADELRTKYLVQLLSSPEDFQPTLSAIRDDVHVPLMHVPAELTITYLDQRKVTAFRYDLEPPPEVTAS